MAKHIRIGIIAEDISDYDSLRNLIPKIKSDSYVFRKALGKGSGRLKSKSYHFSKVLYKQGCTKLIVIRDSDGKNVSELKSEIRNALSATPIHDHVVVIAVQELESWLLADTNAVHQVFSTTKNFPKDIPSPESIREPKEFLCNFIKTNYGKQYLNTIHNAKIAEKININTIVRKCSSFVDLVNFIAPKAES